MWKKNKILLVEDDVDLGCVLKQFIELSDFKVILCYNGREGLRAFKEDDYDLCVLDVRLPEMDGFTLAREIKKINKNVPFIFLTARKQKPDRIKGLELGADDYICKPFEADELLLRIKNIIRRTGKGGYEVFQIGSHEMDIHNLILKKDNMEKRLTVKEAELLRFLYINRNRLVKRSDILIKIWGQDDYFLGRSMDVFISRLRKLFQDDEHVTLENVRGIGFKLKVKN